MVTRAFVDIHTYIHTYMQGQAMVMRAFVDIHSYYIKCDKNQSKRLEIEDVESFAMAQFREIPERLAVSIHDVVYVCACESVYMYLIHMCHILRRVVCYGSI